MLYPPWECLSPPSDKFISETLHPSDLVISQECLEAMPGGRSVWAAIWWVLWSLRAGEAVPYQGKVRAAAEGILWGAWSQRLNCLASLRPGRPLWGQDTFVCAVHELGVPEWSTPRCSYLTHKHCWQGVRRERGCVVPFLVSA